MWVDINKAVQFFPTAPIQTAIQVYDKLSEIIDVNSGVTAGVKGQATEKQVGIYEGNQANARDRFSLISDSEADAQQRFSELYLDGLDEHLTTKVSVEMIGIDGIEYRDVTRKDIKRNREFDVMTITTGQEETAQNTEKRNKLTFLSAKGKDQSGTYNKKIIAEMEASIAGFSNDDIKYMLDTKDEGTEQLMAECAQDIQTMLGGKYIEVNDLANTAYMQKMKDYMRDKKEYMLAHPKVLELFMNYMGRLMPVVIANEQSKVNTTLAKEGIPTLPGQAMGMSGQAVVPGATPQTGGSGGTMNSVAQMSLANYGKK